MLNSGIWTRMIVLWLGKRRTKKAWLYESLNIFFDFLWVIFPDFIAALEVYRLTVLDTLLVLTSVRFLNNIYCISH